MMGVDNMDPKTPPLVMVNVPPCISSMPNSPSRARMAKRLISASICAKLIVSALRTTGTIKPFGELTAMPMSAYSGKMTSLPSIMPLTAGNCAMACVTALVKKLMKPNPTPCASRKASLYFARRSITGFMSTSLNVVNMAVSFLTPTKRSATLRRSMDIFSRRTSRDPPHWAAEEPSNPAANAASTSCFKMRPSRPVP